MFNSLQRSHLSRWASYRIFLRRQFLRRPLHLPCLHVREVPRLAVGSRCEADVGHDLRLTLPLMLSATSQKSSASTHW